MHSQDAAITGGDFYVAADQESYQLPFTFDHRNGWSLLNCFTTGGLYSYIFNATAHTYDDIHTHLPILHPLR